MAAKLISVVAPFHNEAGGVGAFHRAIAAVAAGLPAYAFELVCVDDGSTDSTLAELLELVERDPRVRVLELSRNFGKEAALTAGIDAARGDAVVVIDADLQDPPELIGRMVEEWARGAEVVVAHRTDRSSDSFLKRSSARLFYRLHNRLSSVRIPDDVGDFRLIDRAAVDALKALPERQRFMKGLFAWIGFRTASVDYTRRPRAAGETKFSGWRLWNFALEGFTSFSTVPLRVWTYVGALGAGLTFLYAMFIALRTLIYGVDVPGYASLLVAILFLGSLQLLSIGLLGEYIGRVYLETKQRPVYVVRRVFGGDGP
jgi:glycosyltransferase involved in cell wall biosynthesis